MTKGIRLAERMAGFVQFQNDVERPFEFTIFAYTQKLIQYPIRMPFEGSATFPGFPLSPSATQDDRTVSIKGTMTLSLKGVAYDLHCARSPWGEWNLQGSKVYRWWPWSWNSFRKSLVWLPFTIQQKDSTLARGELEYLLPLWKFPFGLRIKGNAWAHRPHGFLANRFYDLGRALFPDINELGSREEVIAQIEAHLSRTPYLAYLLLSWATYLIRMVCWFQLRKRIHRLSLEEGELLVSKIRKSPLLRLSLLPLMISILTPLFGQKKYLQSKGQNVITPPRSPEIEPWMSHHEPPVRRLHSEDRTIEADVVIVGTGAGGAAFASQMARMGKTVVMLEQGGFFKRVDLSALNGEMMRKLYTRSGIQFSLSNAPLWIPTGRCVGGTTLINSGTCIRTPASVLSRWKSELGLELDFTQEFEAVEEMMGGAQPVPKNIQGGIARVLEKGLQGTGLQSGPLRRAEIGCDGQGACVSGCPTEAKRSTAVSYIPDALKQNAFLFSHIRAKRILTENGKAVGIHAGIPGYGNDFDLIVRAPLVVSAGGAFGTPELLYQSGLTSLNRQVGHHLSIHPAFTVGGLFPEVVRETFFVPQSMGVFGVSEDRLALEGYTLPIDAIAAAMGIWGQELADLLKRVTHFTNFSSMLKDTSEGSLLLTPWGSLPRYHVSPELMNLAHRSMRLIAQIFFQAGAEKVYLPIQGLETISSLKDFPLAPPDDRFRPGDPLHFQEPITSIESIHPSRVITSAHHPLGTCRMSWSENTGAVSPEGEFFGVKNLIVADGSAIPGPLGVNPQVTIMANALRLAKLWSARI